MRLMFGQIIAFTLWIYQLYRPIRMLADKFNILQRGMVRAERIFEILSLDDHIQDEGKEKNTDFNDLIAFKNVSFAYKEPEFVLKNLSFSINPGEMIAFVGATGAGKTSIVNLMARFYDYQKGEILIGSTPINDIPLKT
ncbi:MAG: ABC transporter ATP-binding protein, partial [Crocinitomicaceae bacterium]|nr:ABC transporter ATP-binding protein [Crocinitomicaceae bacterium]